MLEVRGLTKRFGGLLAVNGASLSVAKGSIVALVGPNGAGKTTLFATIAGFFAPNAGSVILNGEEIGGLKPYEICRKGMVRTFQITQPFSRLTVLENIMVGAQLRSNDRREARRQALEIGEKVGMGSYLNARAEDLTVAARKRLELARALATGPQLLLLDEVMAGLNPTEVAQIVTALHAVRHEGVTILLIEHVMQVVMSLAETVYVLNNGRVLSSGTPHQIAGDRSVIEAYLGEGAAARMLNEGRLDARS